MKTTNVNANDAQWHMDGIQFPRLIGELCAQELPAGLAEKLAEEMDVGVAHVTDLFERGQATWDELKSRTRPDHTPYAVTLDDTWHETERGNVLLRSTDSSDLNAWINVGPWLWLDISIRCENHPTMNFQITRASEQQLADHIQKTFGGGGWLAIRCNLPDVRLTLQSEVMGDPAEDQEDEDDI
jgi:hypothetical protein